MASKNPSGRERAYVPEPSCAVCQQSLQTPKGSSVHAWKADSDVGFVFSAPGQKEENAVRPVAGQTGKNLCRALRLLHQRCKSLFPSTCRYKYRITNAWSDVEFEKKTGRSEARNTEVLTQDQRVFRELNGCRIIVFCGDKAILLRTKLEQSGKFDALVCLPHIGNLGLANSTKIGIPGLHRNDERINKWVELLIDQLP